MSLSAPRRFLAELVKTKSFSGHESAAALLCAQRMRELGYKHVKIDEAGNVVGGNYDYTKDPNPDVLLFSHLDTVNGFWLVKTDENGGSGRGAVDAKGCLASYIEAGASMLGPNERLPSATSSGAPLSSLKLVVAGEHLGHLGADEHLAQLADDGPALQEEDAGDEPLRVLHLVDGALPEVVVKLVVAPVLAHLGVHHVLVDGRQFVGQQ